MKIIIWAGLDIGVLWCLFGFFCCFRWFFFNKKEIKFFQFSKVMERKIAVHEMRVS